MASDEQEPLWSASSTPRDEDISVGSNVVGVLASLVTGFTFGVAMEKAHIIEPWSVRSAFLFKRFYFWKIFFSAVASSFFCVLLVQQLAPARFVAARKAYVEGGQSNLKLSGFLLGAFVLGAGLCLAGTCSGIVPMQVAVGTHNSGYTLVACFVGAIIFGFMHPTFLYHNDPPRLCNKFVDEQLSTRYSILAVPIICVMTLGAVLLEYLLPYKADVEYDYGSHSVSTIWLLGEYAWYPAASGVIIGLGQIPIMTALSDTLGMSSSFMTITAQFLRCVPDDMFTEWRRYTDLSMGRIWQVLMYWVAAPAGAYISALLSGGRHLDRAGGPSKAECFIGGFLVILGARISGGCTQGHGISGCAVLFYGSMFAVPAMILGGICTAGVLDLVGMYRFAPQQT